MRKSYRAVKCGLAGLALMAMLVVQPANPAWAEAREVKLAISPGFGFFAVYVTIEHRLIEKYARQAGLGDVTIVQANLTGGAAQNDALLSGSVDIVSSGVPPFLVLWDKTRGRADVKALCSVASMPLFLNTRNSQIRSVKDFTDQDRIALASPKVGPHALVLQMAAAAAFGPTNFAKLDDITVGLAQPDGMTSMLSGHTEIDSHFTVPPFQYLELENPAVHRVLNSYDVLGSPSTFMMAWTTTKFRADNPKLTAAIVAALGEAVEFIAADKAGAAEIYRRVTGDKTPSEKLVAMLNDPEISFTLVPQNVMKQVDFMLATGAIKHRPESWKELFFPEAHDLPGS